MKRVIGAVCLAVWAQIGAAQTIPSGEQGLAWLLNLTDAPAAVNRMERELREQTIFDLGQALRRDPDNPDLSKLLCAVQPWTTGSDAEDAALQGHIWSVMEDLDAQSPAFRWLDCAAVNRQGAYKARAVTPLYDLRQSYCTGVPIAKDMVGFLDRLAADIRDYNRRVETGMGGTGRSYYPVRNVFRLALIHAAQGVALAQSGEEGAARAAFGRAADALRSTLDNLDYANTRNAWVFHGDLTLYATFYRWLATGEPADFSILRAWPAAQDDPVINGAIPQSVVTEMKKNGDDGYVDPVYVERILPGAAPSQSECSGWRRRSFDLRAFAGQIEACADRMGQGPLTGEWLAALDQCISAYEADDWRIQFSSVNPARTRVGVNAAKGLIASLENTLVFQTLSPDAVTRLRANFSGLTTEEANASFVRVVTPHGLLTSDRMALEKMFDELDLVSNRPLMARKKIY